MDTNGSPRMKAWNEKATAIVDFAKKGHIPMSGVLLPQHAGHAPF